MDESLPEVGSPKDHYKVLRELSCEELWDREVPAFDRTAGRERVRRVAVVRAVGVVFAESGTAEQRNAARDWLVQLLNDPEEKVRRYAAAALPKIGAGVPEEARILTLFESAASEREKRHLGRTLEKIGGEATLKMAGGHSRTAQKAAANVARAADAGGIDMEVMPPHPGGLRVHLRCRRGLEGILETEFQERNAPDRKFRLLERLPGRLVIASAGAFSLSDLYAMRCFHTAGIVLGTVTHAPGDAPVEDWASVITSPVARTMLESLTRGPIRYRLEFASRGHQRGLIRELTDRVFTLCPGFLNDSRHAPWQIDIYDTAGGSCVELTPRLRPDPRFVWRQGDVPAASHPPLAASLARLAGPMEGERVWDPFCGSGLELIERALLGGVDHIFGTDLSPDALSTARMNLVASPAGCTPATFSCCDFRDTQAVEGLRPGAISLVVSNPPMGRRVPIADLRGLIQNFMATAAVALRPGGRLVFANPLRVSPANPALKLEFRQKVDLGGFHVHVEKYVKTGSTHHDRKGPRFFSK